METQTTTVTMRTATRTRAVVVAAAAAGRTRRRRWRSGGAPLRPQRETRRRRAPAARYAATPRRRLAAPPTRVSVSASIRRPVPPSAFLQSLRASFEPSVRMSLSSSKARHSLLILRAAHFCCCICGTRNLVFPFIFSLQSFLNDLAPLLRHKLNFFCKLFCLSTGDSSLDGVPLAKEQHQVLCATPPVVPPTVRSLTDLPSQHQQVCVWFSVSCFLPFGICLVDCRVQLFLTCKSTSNKSGFCLQWIGNY